MLRAAPSAALTPVPRLSYVALVGWTCPGRVGLCRITAFRDGQVNTSHEPPAQSPLTLFKGATFNLYQLNSDQNQDWYVNKSTDPCPDEV